MNAKMVANAINLILDGNVTLIIGTGVAKIESQTTDLVYEVSRKGCTCPGFTKWGHCKHHLAYRIVVNGIRAAHQCEDRASVVQSLGVMITPENQMQLWRVATKAISHARRYPVTPEAKSTQVA